MTTMAPVADLSRSPLLRRAMTLVAALALAAAGLLSAGGAHRVAAVWTPTDLTRNPYLSRPHLVVDGASTDSVVYERQGDNPGVIVSTGSGSTWTDTRLDSGVDYDAVIALDAGGKRHVAFARAGAGQGIYYATDATGSWSAPLRVTTDMDGVPSIAVDAAGHVHIAYISFGFSPGLYYATNATGTWVRSRLFGASLDYWPSIGIDSAGHVHIGWVRFAPEAPGLYYVTNATGTWAATRLTTYFASEPALAIDGSDKVHIAFVRWQSTWSALYSTTDETGSWIETQLWDDSAYDIGAPTISIDQGSTYVVAPRWPKDPASSGAGLTIFFGGGMYHLPNDPAETDDDMPSMAFDTAAHRVHLAFQRTLPTPGIAYYEAANNDLTTALDSRTLAGSVMDSAPSLAMDGTFNQHLAFERDSTGSDNGIEAATDASGSWVFANAAGTQAPPAEAVDGSGHDHIAYSDGTNVHHVTNATGSWVDEVVGPGSDPGIALDAADHVTLVYKDGASIVIARNATGSWVLFSFVSSSGGRPSVAVDGSGHTHFALIDSTFVVYYNDVSGSWQALLVVPSADSPSLALDGSGHVHLTYRSSGSAPGTYYATDKTGSWVTTRLTRTNAETAPSIAVDPAGHVFIAMARYYWAANPGIFIVSNRTGPWVTTQLTTKEGDVDPAIGTDGSGRLRIVYDSQGYGLSDLVESDPLGLTHSVRPTAAWQRAVADLFGHNDRGGLLGLLHAVGGSPGDQPSAPRQHAPSTGAVPGGVAADSGAGGFNQP
jgi:hypothetical protein